MSLTRPVRLTAGQVARGVPPFIRATGLDGLTGIYRQPPVHPQGLTNNPSPIFAFNLSALDAQTHTLTHYQVSSVSSIGEIRTWVSNDSIIIQLFCFGKEICTLPPGSLTVAVIAGKACRGNQSESRILPEHCLKSQTTCSFDRSHKDQAALKRVGLQEKYLVASDVARRELRPG